MNPAERDKATGPAAAVLAARRCESHGRRAPYWLGRLSLGQALHCCQYLLPKQPLAVTVPKEPRYVPVLEEFL